MQIEMGNEPKPIRQVVRARHRDDPTTDGCSKGSGSSTNDF